MRILDPKETHRALAHQRWHASPMPMISFTKTFDISHLLRLQRRKGYKLYPLMMYCIGMAAKDIREFYYIAFPDKLVEYDKIAVQGIIADGTGDFYFCDVPLVEDINTFMSTYTSQVATIKETHDNVFHPDHVLIGTSCINTLEFDSCCNQYVPEYTNPFLCWGKYRKGWFRTTLPITIQVNHQQMDGGHVALFLNRLQEIFNTI
ncbi:MAG: CatA-like O-acetyltransferase [Bacteroidia bacterium]|nr:CatA-like O-acetyltransferase [Bacteroidia bacterium]